MVAFPPVGDDVWLTELGERVPFVEAGAAVMVMGATLGEEV